MSTEIEKFNTLLKELKSTAFQYIEIISGRSNDTDILSSEELDQIRSSIKVKPEEVDKRLFLTLEKCKKLKENIDKMIMKQSNEYSNTYQITQRLLSGIPADILLSFGKALEWEESQKLKQKSKSLALMEDIKKNFEKYH